MGDSASADTGPDSGRSAAEHGATPAAAYAALAACRDDEDDAFACAARRRSAEVVERQ